MFVAGEEVFDAVPVAGERLGPVTAVHRARTGQSTELVCFRLDESLVLDKVEELRADRDAAQGLPLVSFIAWNRLSRGRLAGREF